MDAWLISLYEQWPLLGLFAVIAAFLAILAKGADLLVEEAVVLSLKWGVPPLVIGATIVSLGTTTPEMAVSVAAAVQGRPELALGNAVGSIICDTGLILGLAAMLGRIPIHPKLVNRQGWLQLGSGFLLVALCLPWSNLGETFTLGGNLPRYFGWMLLVLLGVYIWKSIVWARQGQAIIPGPEVPQNRSILPTMAKLTLGITLVVLSSKFLIPAVEVTAVRLHVPQSIIAATLVAFGTSLPELVTCIAAVRKAQGGLALGNVIGADILNVLFVAGAAASVTPLGLQAEPKFFYFLFPAMLLLLILLRVLLWTSPGYLGKRAGALLLGGYLVFALFSFLLR